MITLPTPPRRAHLRSFWIALCAMLGSSATIIMWFFALPHPLTIPLATGTGLVAVGLMMTEWIRPFYAIWNKVARRAAYITRLALMGICYFVVFAGCCSGRREIYPEAPSFYANSLDPTWKSS